MLLCILVCDIVSSFDSPLIAVGVVDQFILPMHVVHFFCMQFVQYYTNVCPLCMYKMPID